MGSSREARFLEACLSPAESIAAWAAAITERAAPIFDRGGGHGAALSLMHHDAGGAVETALFVAHGPQEVAHGLSQDEATDYRARYPRAFAPFTIATLTTLLGRASLVGEPFWDPILRRGRYVDQLGVNASSDTSVAILSSTLGPRGWDRRHLAEVRAMRRHLLRVVPARMRGLSPDAADAVIAPDGRVLAIGTGLGATAPAILSAAVRALERARMNDSDGDAERLWSELLDGRWSAVEHVDRDGKRTLLLARTSNPRAALTRDEAQLLAELERGRTVKQLALDQEVPISTMSERLTTALGKLGFRSRAEYLRFAPARRPPNG